MTYVRPDHVSTQFLLMEKQRRQAIQQSVQCTSSFVEYVLYFIKQLEAEFQSDIHK